MGKFDRIAVVSVLLIGSGAIVRAADVPVTDAPSAIKRAQLVCKLEPTSISGDWQATLRKDSVFGDEWHVWFGILPEPVCGFAGAIVKADGSYTSCVVTACKRMGPEPSKRP